MKTIICSLHRGSLLVKLLALAVLAFSLAARTANAAPQVTIVGGILPLGNTTWALAGNPYQVDSYIDVPEGATLTIEAGVVVEDYSGSGFGTYNFDVEGTLLANGTAGNEIHFNPGTNGWSGIRITGQLGNINTGSNLTYVIAEGGGQGGSGVGANLVLQYSEVDVHHCQFNNSPGDGILGDNASTQGVANIYDTSFTGNAGYAVDFEDGSVNPILSNLTASGNGGSLPHGGDYVYINDATLHGAHTWENMGLPYLILGTNVGTDSNLIIQPGVQVYAYPGNDALDVQGELFADGGGTSGGTIHFDPIDQAAGWSGIAFMGTAELPGAGGDFNNVFITKGGYAGNCDVYIEYGNVTITNSRLDSSEDSGVCLDHGASLVMTNTLITGNGGFAMDVYDADDRFYLHDLNSFFNLHNSIGIEGGTLTDSHTWYKSGTNTYDLAGGSVTVATTGTLNIEPGVTVLFGVSRDITVQGALTAVGTPTDPILFSSEILTPSQWAGINFVGTAEQHAEGRFAYTTIEYGGYGGSAMVSLENADVIFQHCVLRYCSGDAIKIYPGQALAGLPDEAQVNLPLQINWSDLYGISGLAILNGSSQSVQALYDWWGAASGPAADDNPDGTGSGLSGLVLYRPYITGPDGSFIYLPVVKRP